MVATAGDDHVVRIWSTSTGRIVHTLNGHQDWVRSARVQPRRPGAGLRRRRPADHSVECLDRQALERLPPHPHAVYSMAYNPEGSRLAAVGFEHTVRLYDPDNGAQVRELEGPGTDLRSVVFSPDGQQLAVGGRNGQIRVWSVPAGTIALEIAAGRGRIRTWPTCR